MLTFETYCAIKISAEIQIDNNVKSCLSIIIHIVHVYVSFKKNGVACVSYWYLVSDLHFIPLYVYRTCCVLQ